MKKSDKIPLATSTTTIDTDGERVSVVDTRSVESEIERLLACGCLEAAQRLENSCEDGEDDNRTGYVEIDPTNVVVAKVGKRDVPVAFVAPLRLALPVETNETVTKT